MNDIRYKEFLNEESESLSEFKIQALLVISNKSGRMKTDILSNIRAIQGITRVHVDENVCKFVCRDYQHLAS